MLLHDLAVGSQRIAETSRRLEKIDLLATLLRQAAPDEVAVVARFLSGTLTQGRIGVGPAVITTSKDVPASAEPSLTVSEVDRAFDRVANAAGKGSQGLRREILGSLFTRSTAAEQRFLANLLFGELRQGAAPGLMAEAIAKTAALDPGDVRRAIMVHGELGDIARTALTEGSPGLGRIAAELFRPLQPMLAQPSETGDALKQLGEALLEWKLDGARIQVHKDGDDVRVYSRQLREVTEAVPEVVNAARVLPVRSLILDGEVIALRPDGSPHPFQVTMRRFGSKGDAPALRETLPLTPFFFDLLHLDGDLLLDRPQIERSTELARIVAPETLIPRLRTTAPDLADEFLRAARTAGHEGIMAKSLVAPYEAGSRGSAWLKIKPVHTLDLVVLAAEWGHGRRRGWLSNLHLGARDERRGGFVMLGKTFKGLTDAMLQWQTDQLLARELGRDWIVVHVRPELVVEIAFNDVQASPQYPGGVALRFARVKRYRSEKPAAEADTIEAVHAIYRSATGEDPPVPSAH
ncbi:MAG: ATP-dependent DNA ligase [Candidatus Eisenbacteria bacterium]